MSRIDDKWTSLHAGGVDLGGPLGPEEDAGFGGQMRRYEHGHIYHHPVMGDHAHAVQGGILQAYLGQGGHDVAPDTGRRRFGFPLSDEEDARFGGRVSRFEWGAIYWVPGRGAIAVYGPVYPNLRRVGERWIGLPVTEPIPLAGGEAVYFERGCVWATEEIPNGVLVGRLDVPGMGRPGVLDRQDPEHRRFRRLATFPDASHYDELVAWRASVFSEIWSQRLALVPVLEKGLVRRPLNLDGFQVSRFHGGASVAVELTVHPGGDDDIADRTLYDLAVMLPSEAGAIRYAVIAPHCFYAASQWERFGLLHVTDLHVSRRNEEFRERLRGLGLEEAADAYANFQDGVRDFCRYANHLHKRGFADVAIATGDLVDYVYEYGDSPSSGGNFALFERLLRGGAGAEELRIPIFTSFGNHDYRLWPYALRGYVPVAGSEVPINQYPSHNLKPDEVEALQGARRLELGKERAVDMVRIDRDNMAGDYDYYVERLNDERNYTVELGPHRIVMGDTGPDVGVPQDASFSTQALLIWKELAERFSEDEKAAQTGSPNSQDAGTAINLLRDALAEDTGGLVILGMHAPPFAPPMSEYPYFLRETQHPFADPAQVPNFLKRGKQAPWMKGWVPSGTPYFKTGLITDGLDHGVARDRADELIRLAAGEGAPRPADLILCGHQHDRVEFRFRIDPDSGEVQFYMDFYLENPQRYYWTPNNIESPTLPEAHPIHIVVREGAPPDASPAIVRDHLDGDVISTTATLEVPTYPTPLDSAQDVRGWWDAHRPLMVQTCAVGVLEPRQRFDPKWTGEEGDDEWVESATRPPGAKPLAPFQVNTLFRGFRLLQIQDNLIAKIRHIELGDLHGNDFQLPWEPPGQAPLWTETESETNIGGVGGGMFHP